MMNEPNEAHDIHLNNEEEIKPKGFFKKIAYSVTKIEKYPEMSAEGFGRAFSYLIKLVAILALILSIWIVCETNSMIQKGSKYLEENMPNITYKDGTLNIESDEVITAEKQDSSIKIVADTKEVSKEKLDEYFSYIERNNTGIIVLKDKILVSNGEVKGTITYSYNEILTKLNITEFTKQDLINYIQSNQMIMLYLSVFITLFLYSMAMYLLTTLWNVLLVSIVGQLASIFIRLKMRYVAIFNMAVYAVTLPLILNAIYLITNIFIDFNIEYFRVMYISVAAIYIIAAIFILKSEFIKKQQELIKIVEVQKVVKQELEQEKEKQEQKNKEQKKKDKKEDKEKEETKDDLEGETEGNNA